MTTDDSLTPGDRSAGTYREVIGELVLPGIADVHVHVMPPRVMQAVWRYFDSAGPLVGRPWPIRYRGTDDERLHFLRAAGVGLFAGLSYAHKPGMAQFLTDWSLRYAAEVPEAVATGTFYPEAGVGEYVVAAIEAGCQLFKLHLQVGDFDPRDPVLADAWDAVAMAGTPVLVHAGSGPVPGRFTGPVPIEGVLAEHPGVRMIVAHFGAPQERDFVDLALRHDTVGLDTTMVDTDFTNDMAWFDRSVLPSIRELGLDGRVFYGTDFPNIPYRYDHQLEVLMRWDLGDDWLRAVLWHNAVRLLGAG